MTTARHALPFTIRAQATETKRLDFLPEPMTFDALTKVMTAVGLPIPVTAISAAARRHDAGGREHVKVRGFVYDRHALDEALAKTALTPEKRIALKASLHETGLLA